MILNLFKIYNLAVGMMSLCAIEAEENMLDKRDDQVNRRTYNLS